VFFCSALVGRWHENNIHVQRLKDKVGNRSNSSSEVEFKNAWGIMIGEAGRGFPPLLKWQIIRA
jgi:putative acyl-CoA dehydrogenase